MKIETIEIKVKMDENFNSELEALKRELSLIPELAKLILESHEFLKNVIHVYYDKDADCIIVGFTETFKKVLIGK